MPNEIVSFSSENLYFSQLRYKSIENFKLIFWLKYANNLDRYRYRPNKIVW